MTWTSTTLHTADNDRETLCIHWRAVFAGLFISLLAYSVLMALGLAFGATGLQRIIEEGGSLESLGSGIGMWTIISALIALFVGAYASGRVSGIVVTRIGYMQGSVISSLFFIVMLSQVGLGVGLAGIGVGGLASSLGGGIADLIKTPQIEQMMEDSLSDVELNSPAPAVISGLISRLSRGDTNSALTFLAAQTDMSRSDAAVLLKSIDEKFHQTINEVAQKTSAAAKWIGWTAFVALAFGTLSSLIGGAIGAQVNQRRPLAAMDRRVINEPYGARL